MPRWKFSAQVRTGWFAGAIAAVAMIAAACGVGSNGTDGDFSDPRMQTLPDQGRNHFPALGMSVQTYADLTGFSGYNSLPPTSGPHDPRPLPCGVYHDDQRVEAAVHTMEHGGVILYYQPETFSLDEVAELRALAVRLRANDDARLVLTPNQQLQSRIVITAWAVLLALDNFEEDTITEFVNFYSGRFNPEGLANHVAC